MSELGGSLDNPNRRRGRAVDYPYGDPIDDPFRPTLGGDPRRDLLPEVPGDGWEDARAGAFLEADFSPEADGRSAARSDPARFIGHVDGPPSLSSPGDGRSTSSTAMEALMVERRRRAAELQLEADQSRARLGQTSTAERMGTDAAERERERGLELATGLDSKTLGAGAADPAREEILKQTAGLPEHLAKMVAEHPSQASLALARFAETRHADRAIVVARGQFAGHGPNESGEVTVEEPGVNQGRVIGRAAVDDVLTSGLDGNGVATPDSHSIVEGASDMDGAAERMLERQPGASRSATQRPATQRPATQRSAATQPTPPGERGTPAKSTLPALPKLPGPPQTAARRAVSNGSLGL